MQCFNCYTLRREEKRKSLLDCRVDLIETTRGSVKVRNRKILERCSCECCFSQAEDEVVNARVYVGIHYRGTDRVARTQGLRVANWIFKNYFRPIGDARFGAQH